MYSFNLQIDLIQTKFVMEQRIVMEFVMEYKPDIICSFAIPILIQIESI